MIEQDDGRDKLKAKAKKFNGLLEWILQQEGHEYLCEVDRKFIINKDNLIGIKEKMREDLNLKPEQLDDR